MTAIRHVSDAILIAHDAVEISRLRLASIIGSTNICLGGTSVEGDFLALGADAGGERAREECFPGSWWAVEEDAAGRSDVELEEDLWV